MSEMLRCDNCSVIGERPRIGARSDWMSVFGGRSGSLHFCTVGCLSRYFHPATPRPPDLPSTT